jgi:glyoxylase-like metal-dependent hydrolase (beta-lactamase superfamily II)
VWDGYGRAMRSTRTWKIGDLSVTRVQEYIGPGIELIVPEVNPANLATIDWIGPFVGDDGGGRVAIQSLIVDDGDQRTIVDTCVGNDKQRGVPFWNMLQGPFLDDLTEAGFPAESIDTVVCTHLHVDHVGCNTRLIDGRWVPTFPNARYLLSRTEWEHWSEEDDAEQQTILGDSVRPIFDAGLVDLVDTPHATGNIELIPTPGHTPGHLSVAIESHGERAVITGDLLHHPAQIAHPEWRPPVDSDPELAVETRRRFLADHADTPTLVIGTHFAGPTAGHVVRDGDNYRFAV